MASATRNKELVLQLMLGLWCGWQRLKASIHLMQTFSWACDIWGQAKRLHLSICYISLIICVVCPFL